MKYRLIGSNIICFDGTEQIVGVLSLDKEGLNNVKNAVYGFDRILVRELIAVHKNYDDRKEYYLEQVYKLFYKPDTK